MEKRIWILWVCMIYHWKGQQRSGRWRVRCVVVVHSSMYIERSNKESSKGSRFFMPFAIKELFSSFALQHFSLAAQASLLFLLFGKQCVRAVQTFCNLLCEVAPPPLLLRYTNFSVRHKRQDSSAYLLHLLRDVIDTTNKKSPQKIKRVSHNICQ